jgi:NADPH-dependent glutamate synthase beta subunit-like oxidoreductase
MGRVCPAPCEEGCNRNDVEEFVGINSVEQYIGDIGCTENYSYGDPGKDTGKKIAIVGGGPGGLAAAHQLRLLGHGVTLFDDNAHLGGMMRYGIPNYRIPRDTLEAEIQRIIDLGVEVRLNTWVGKDVSMEDIDKEYDAVIWAVGLQNGRALPLAGWEEASNCVDAVAFLKAYNQGRMKVTASKVVCIGGGDTSIDVVSVTRRIGSNPDAGLPEEVVSDINLDQDKALNDAATPAAATLTSLFTRENMFAQPHEMMPLLKVSNCLTVLCHLNSLLVMTVVLPGLRSVIAPWKE